MLIHQRLITYHTRFDHYHYRDMNRHDIKRGGGGGGVPTHVGHVKDNIGVRAAPAAAPDRM